MGSFKPLKHFPRPNPGRGQRCAPDVVVRWHLQAWGCGSASEPSCFGQCSFQRGQLRSSSDQAGSCYRPLQVGVHAALHECHRLWAHPHWAQRSLLVACCSHRQLHTDSQQCRSDGRIRWAEQGCHVYSHLLAVLSCPLLRCDLNCIFQSAPLLQLVLASCVERRLERNLCSKPRCMQSLPGCASVARDHTVVYSGYMSYCQL